jgi:lysozyme
VTRGRTIALGLGLGALGWMIFRGGQGAPVDTDSGEAQPWLNGVDDLIGAAYQVSSVFQGEQMQISLAGLAALKKVEALRLQRYDDATGKPLSPGDTVKGFATIGYGHKLLPNETYWTIDEITATRLLIADLTDAEAAVNNLVKVPLQQNQYDALVSFVFNVGAGAFRRSTLLKRLNAGNYAAAADQFPLWRKSNGVVMAGLVNRRVHERAMFIGQGVAV